ncbi:MAG: ATP-grasp domain-containing protein [Bacilli bacterium]|jgi:hypothetical protein|nr:ATP-grasp domain-containing protein [Bacilli bacterium]
MNFVFISPHFPDSYWRFCKGLKENGVTVCGIADMPYDNLPQEVKNSLSDYYCVHDLKNYDEKYRAIGYFISRHGRINFIESNNEFWMQDDARLRTDFGVTSGPDLEQVKYFRHKSLMKEKYALAGVKTARWHLIDDFDGCKKFIEEVHYPVCVKPDDGVGSAHTYKIHNDTELKLFLEQKREKDRTYIMEQFVDGELISFDGVCDSHGDVVYPTHHVFPLPIMDIVIEYTDSYYYTSKTIPADLKDAGQRVLHAFGAKSRFYHLEFFRLTHDQEGLGKKGELIGLEVNMRVPGGYTPDMIDFAYSIDIYKIWADVMAFDENRENISFPPMYCAYSGRRFDGNYVHNWNDVLNKYHDQICFCKNNPPILADGMGDYFFMAKFETLEEVNSFFEYTLERKTAAPLAKF